MRVLQLQHMLAQHTRDHIATHTHKLILRVEIVERRVLRRVQLLQNQLANRLGVLLPLRGLHVLTQRARHRSQRHSPAVHRRRKVRAQPGHTRNRGTLARVGIRATVGDARPARAVVVARVVGAEALHQPRAARVAIAPQPRIPPAARRIGRVQQLVVMRPLCQIPRRGRDRHHHLNLPIAHVAHLHARGQLPVLALQREEGHVIRPRDLLWRGLGRSHKLAQRRVDQPLMRATLLPYAGIHRALQQHGLVIARHPLHIPSQHGQRGVPGARPLRVFRIAPGHARHPQGLRASAAPRSRAGHAAQPQKAAPRHSPRHSLHAGSLSPARASNARHDFWHLTPCPAAPQMLEARRFDEGTCS